MDYHIRPGWAAIQSGGGDGRQQGVVRKAFFSALPGVGSRFCRMFPQDPMHDIDEGVARFFVQTMLANAASTERDRRNLHERYTSVVQTVPPCFNLPTLEPRDFIGGDKLHLSGMCMNEYTACV